MYVILVDDVALYAATSELRFGRELRKYANIANARWELRKSQAK